MNGRRNPLPPRAVGILARTALFSWLVSMVTLAIFIALVIPGQRSSFLGNLASKARGVAASLQDIAAGAAVSEDYSAIVDHCTRIIAEDPSIEYLVLTRKDGFSLFHDRAGWRSEELGGMWLPEERTATGMIRPLEAGKGEVYNYSLPFDYSGIEWGWIHVGLSLDSYTKNVQGLYHRTLLSGLLCLVLGLVASVFYARQLTRPIMQLRRAVLSLAEGDLSVRARVYSSDEVGELSASFNRMAESLLQRDTMLQAVRFAAQRFLAAEDWGRAIRDVLANLGRASGASRVYVFQNRNIPGKGLAMSQLHEWIAPDSQSEIDASLLVDLPYEELGLGRWVRMLESGSPVAGARHDFPDAEGAVLERLGIRSVAFAPVHVGSRWWGVIGVEDCRKERDWSDAEITSLRAAADTLGAAIERDDARKALLLAKDSAEAASEAKSQFLANMSHEIRTPITGVIGMLHLLRRTELSDRQSHYVNNAASAAETLLAVIGDVLDFSKIEAGRLELDESTISIPGMLDSAVGVFAERAEARGVELAYRLGPKVPRYVEADADRLRQVLVNLVANALKFTESGEVVVACDLEAVRVDSDVLRFTVRDTGCGIAPEHQAMIFNAFSQADSSMSRRHGGTGLGLAICRQICELMGGRIGVESVPGRGSTFWFTARLKRAPAVQEDPARPLRSLEGLRVLVVDDCDTTRNIVAEYVTAWKGSVRTAADASAGLEALREAAGGGAPFQVAVLDWKMPGVDGVMMARLIKEVPSLRDTALVLMGGFAQTSEADDDAGGPFASSVPKPVRASELYDAIVVAANGRPAGRRRARASGVLPVPRAEAGREDTVILLVEDNEINREVASEMIAELGFICLHAVNGREAVERVRGERVDVVLMDCQMPVMDGYEATEVIRRRERTESDPSRGRHIPIIALTAHAMKEDRDTCLSAGMDDFLTKPLDPGKLARMIEKWMNAGTPGSGEGCDPDRDREGPGTEVSPAVRPGGATSDPIDFDDLVRRCMGKIELAERSVARFVNVVEEYARQAIEAVEREDSASLEYSAHRLKGAAATVSAVSLSRIAAELEVRGLKGELTGTPELVDRLRAEVRRIVRRHGGGEREAA